MKAYKLLDLETNWTFISRDIIFHETTFPLFVKSSFADLTFLFPNIVLPLSIFDSTLDKTTSSSGIPFVPESTASTPSTIPSVLPTDVSARPMHIVKKPSYLQT